MPHCGVSRRYSLKKVLYGLDKFIFLKNFPIFFTKSLRWTADYARFTVPVSAPHKLNTTENQNGE
jgi:hypothetical protein